MYHIHFSRKSQRTLRKLRGSGRFDEALVAFVLNELAQGNVLPDRFQNHPLQGKFVDCFECHLKSDLLLIYKVDVREQKLAIVLIGSHSELFR